MSNGTFGGRSRAAINIAEFAIVIVVAVLVIAAGWKIVGDGTLARQLVIWVANVMMLATVWLGLRLRNQTWAHFGLAFTRVDRRALLRVAVQSVVVFLAALLAFVVGAILMGMIVGRPTPADMSSYAYLQGNLPMLLLALAGVYVVSSFGEEAIYRGFLMTRIAEMGGAGKWAWRAAVAVSAVVFGLIHFGWGLAGIVQTTFMGLALAVAYLIVGRNLWVLVLAHAYMDTILLVQLYMTPVPAS